MNPQSTSYKMPAAPMTSSVYSRQSTSRSSVRAPLSHLGGGPLMMSMSNDLPMFKGYGDPGEDEAPRSKGGRSRGGSKSSSRSKGSSRSKASSRNGGEGEDEEYIGMGGTFSENQQALGAYRGGLEKTEAGRHHLYGKPSDYGSEMGLGPFTRLFAAVNNGQIKDLHKDSNLRHLMGGSTSYATNAGAGPGSLKGKGDPYIERLNAAHQQYLARGQANQTPPAPPSSQIQPTSSSNNKNGYGAFLNLPPGSRVDRRFVDSDGDGIDDRYQSGPGQPRGGGTKPNVPVRPSPIRPTPPPAPTAPTPPPALPNNPSSGINWRKKRRS